jgi:hypothetical protein
MTTSTEYTWAVANLERSVADGMVQTVHYTINASDGTYASSAYGSIGLDAADPEAMVPYAELTPELCIDWVKEKLGGEEKVAEIEAALQAQIDEQRQPSKAAGVPWG